LLRTAARILSLALLWLVVWWLRAPAIVPPPVPEAPKAETAATERVPQRERFRFADASRAGIDVSLHAWQTVQSLILEIEPR